jgi:hypothetical protein
MSATTEVTSVAMLTMRSSFHFIKHPFAARLNTYILVPEWVPIRLQKALAKGTKLSPLRPRYAFINQLNALRRALTGIDKMHRGINSNRVRHPIAIGGGLTPDLRAFMNDSYV